MTGIDQDTPLQDLLDQCSDPDSGHWQIAWKQFLTRYKRYMYSVILRRCLKFHHPRIQRQLSEIVNDILGEVVMNLYKNDCRALRKFRARDNEKVFLSFLAVICNMTTSSHLKKLHILPLLDQNPELLQNFFHETDYDMRWHIYEDCVTVLREDRQGAGNAERDIAIFNLYVISGFTDSMIRSIPSYADIGHRTVDNVVHRARNCLKANSSWYDFL